MKHKRKKILLMTMTRRIGGIEVLIKDIAKYIDQEKYEIAIVMQGTPYILDKEFTKRKQYAFHISTLKKPFHYIKDLCIIIKNGHFDIVHIHKCSCANFISALICYLYRVPCVIVHAHATTSFTGMKGKILHHLGQWIIRFCSHQKVACSRAAADWLFGRKYCQKYDVKIIKNGINITDFCFQKSIREKQRKELGYNHEIVFGHVGRFCEAKNHRFLIEVFYAIYQHNTNARLLLIGQGELENEIKEKVSQLKLKHAVCFLEECQPIAPYYQAMDIFLFPSLYEAFPLALIEAQTTGLPCLVSKELALEDMKDIEYMDLSKSAEEWAQKALTLIHGDRKTYNSQFDIQHTITKICELYERG